MAKTTIQRMIHRGLTRRNVLQGASAGLAASLLHPFSRARAQGAEAVAATSPPSLTPADMPAAWSVEEIHRRWGKVRERMRELELDCLLVPQHRPGAMITERVDGDLDVEWLTGNSLPFKYVILPYEGTVTAISGGKIRRTPEEKLTADRGIEVRIAQEGQWSAAIIDSLREKGMTRARIGVGNLVDASRQPEGEINYTTYDRVLKALPQARFESAADLLWRVKLVHSPEEIAVLEKSAAVGEIGLRAMMETARPGVIHRVVWLAMYQAMVNATGERPFRLSIAAGAPANSTVNRPIEDVLMAGQILSQECTGTVLGCGTQVNQSVLLGSPAPADWVSVGQYSLDTFHSVVDAVAPGKTVHEVSLIYDKRREALGQSPGAGIFHSSEVRTGSGPDRFASDVVFEPGMVFDIKPAILLKDGQPAHFGDSVVVTETGTRRLGKRELKLITLGA